MTKRIFYRFFVAIALPFLFSFGSTDSNAFLKKLHTAYMGQMRVDVGKTFASAMQKNEGICLSYNDPAFDDIKKSTNTWKFNPKGPMYAKYAVCVSYLQHDDAKDIMKKVKKGIGTGTSATVKSPLLVFRVGKIIYTVSYGCDLKDTGTEKLLIDELKKEAETEGSNDFVIVKCGGAVVLKN